MNDELNCDQVVQKLWQFLDGELDGETCQELQRHLEACRHCFSRVEFERHLKAMVRRSCEEEQVPPELQERLTRMLRLF